MSSLYTILIVLWALTLLFLVLWLVSCCFCACLCPSRLKRLLGFGLLLLLVTSVLTTALTFHKLEELGHAVGSAAVGTFHAAQQAERAAVCVAKVVK
jgi:hypothetical protein